VTADITNMFFITLFTVEMFIKMYAVGFVTYFGSMFNRFDFFVIVFSWVEAVLTHPEVRLMKPLGVSVLRCARLLRVFKVTRSRAPHFQIGLCFVFVRRAVSISVNLEAQELRLV